MNEVYPTTIEMTVFNRFPFMHAKHILSMPQYFDVHSADVSSWAMGKLVSYREQISRVL